MGLKDFDLMNSTHLAKQAWRAILSPTTLWVQILKAFYFPDSDFLHASRKRNDSLVWASLNDGKENIMNFTGWSIGVTFRIFDLRDKVSIREDYE